MGGSRYVERRNHGQSAKFEFDEVVGSKDAAVLFCLGLGSEALAYGSVIMRTLEERMRGWIGIQHLMI